MRGTDAMYILQYTLNSFTTCSLIVNQSVSNRVSTVQVWKVLTFTYNVCARERGAGKREERDECV